MIIIKLSVKELSELALVSVRTLHYYDEIRLLKPFYISENGYRYYNEENVEHLQQILFFRELDFSLDEIKKILGNKDYDKIKTLKKQKELLQLKYNRLQKIMNLVDSILEGEVSMSFKEFDKSEIEKKQEQYAKEVEARWGNTKEYKENIQKTSNYSKDDYNRIQEEGNKIFAEFASIMHLSPDSCEAEDLVIKWQNHISKNFYQCSNEILSNLAEMYVQDERFKNNIDAIKEGLTEFISKAIKHYTSK